MEKLKMETKDLLKENIEKLAEIFPGIITEARDEKGNQFKAVDFELLKQELSDRVVEGDRERYQLTWPGKKEAMLLANMPINKTLRPVKEESVDWENTGNIYIEGDNLEALKILQESYLNKIKCIYIDPPYNTGKDFIYKDNFKQSREEYLAESGQVDGDGNRLFQNTESNGRFHSEWLSMMYPRLKLARNLLREDGVIFISIDENEMHNLRKICDEIFGEDNFINVITCKTKIAGVSGSHLGKSLQNNVEYILWYAKNIDMFIIKKPPFKKQELLNYINTMDALNKSWKYTSIIKDLDDGIYIKTIEAGNGDKIKVYKHEKFTISSVNQIANKFYNGDIGRVYYSEINNIFRTTNAQSSIRTRVVQDCEDVENEIISIEYIPQKGKNSGVITRLYYKDKARNLIAWLRDVVVLEDGIIYKLDNKGNLWDDLQYNNLTREGDIKFPNGKKPLQMVMDIINMICDEDSIILDFFSGSATTAHATIAKNSMDNGNRRFIMVQYPEVIEPIDKDSKEYIEYLSSEGIQPIVTEIGKERIRRAGKKIKEENGADIDYGFRVFRVDSSNMKDVYYRPEELSQQDLFGMVSNIKEDRTGEDLLIQVMLEWGLELSLPMEKRNILGKEVHFVAGNSLVACFDEGVSEELVRAIAKEKPLRVVFRDSSFADDAARINVEELFKMLSPTTEIKVI